MISHLSHKYVVYEKIKLIETEHYEHLGLLVEVGSQETGC